MIVLKKFLIFVCALSMVFSCLSVVHADGEENAGETPVEESQGETPSPVVVVSSGDDAAPPAVVVYDLDDASAPVSGTLPALAASVFGSYTPRTQSVITYLPDGTTVESTEVVHGLAGVDWHWISGAAVFMIVLWSFFALLGVVFKHG